MLAFLWAEGGTGTNSDIFGSYVHTEIIFS